MCSLNYFGLLFFQLFCSFFFFFFFKQKTAYEIRISDWSSDVCSSDLFAIVLGFLLEFSRRDDVRHAVQLLLDHQADRLSIRNDGVALLRAVQSPALCLDGRDQLVENGTGDWKSVV